MTHKDSQYTRTWSWICVLLILGSGITLGFVHLDRRADITPSANDTLVSRSVAPGVIHRRIVKEEGPWKINVLEIDLRRLEIEIESARALDQLRGREKTSSIAARKESALSHVVAALNADFFDLKTGENENNQIINGLFVKGVKVTDSPHDTFDNAHSQFALSFSGRPFLDRFAFSGRTIWKDHSTSDLLGVNILPDTGALIIFNSYYGASSPKDTLHWGVTEAELFQITERADTLVCYVRGHLQIGGGSPIPEHGMILAGYRGSQSVIESKLSPGDTVKVVLTLEPNRARIKTLVGGWPRIVANGKNVAGSADSMEGTFPRFSKNRHPRSGVGFSRDSTTLYFVTVDGRQNSSAGMSLIEFADLMISIGIFQGLNLDGGGSTTLVVDGQVVNSPSDSTGERHVGNCLLVLLKKVKN